MTKDERAFLAAMRALPPAKRAMVAEIVRATAMFQDRKRFLLTARKQVASVETHEGHSRSGRRVRRTA